MRKKKPIQGPLLGAHVSARGRFSSAFDRAHAVGAECIQIFTRPPGMWRGRVISDDEAVEFRARHAEVGSPPLMAHDAYLTNLASPDTVVRDRSIAGLAEERRRCDKLGIPMLVLHMGAHLGSGLQPGLQRFADGLKSVLHQTSDVRVRMLLESSAGQGTCLGHRFSELAFVLDDVQAPELTGVLLDTCHVFAAGYNIATPEGYAACWAEFESTVGLHRLFGFHLNDSQKPVGCRVDRHSHIGYGEIGEAAFGRLLTDPRVAGLPMVIETPEDNNMNKKNLRLLKRLRKADREIR